MHRKPFKLWHSVFGLAALLFVQSILAYAFPVGAMGWLILLSSIVGSLVALYVATEVIKEVRNARHMLVLLSAVVAEFVVFFSIEYYYLLSISPASFPTLPQDGVSLLLQSIMVFVFNPLYLPATFLGRALLLINTASSLGLVLFVLQNIWQFRRFES